MCVMLISNRPPSLQLIWGLKCAESRDGGAPREIKIRFNQNDMQQVGLKQGYRVSVLQQKIDAKGSAHIYKLFTLDDIQLQQCLRCQDEQDFLSKSYDCIYPETEQKCPIKQI